MINKIRNITYSDYKNILFNNISEFEKSVLIKLKENKINRLSIKQRIFLNNLKDEI